MGLDVASVYRKRGGAWEVTLTVCRLPHRGQAHGRRYEAYWPAPRVRA